MKDIERTANAISRGITAIDDALATGNIPDKGPISVDQLGKFRSQLRSMLDGVEGRALSSQERPLRRMGLIITDSWPLESELSDALLKAENEYVTYMTAQR